MNKLRANKYGYLFLKAATGELTLVRAAKISALIEDGDLTAVWAGEEAFFVQESPETIFEQLDDICPNML